MKKFKLKSEKGSTSLLIIVTLIIFIITVTGLEFFGAYDQAISNTGIFNIFKMSISLGGTLILISVSMPKKYYKTNGKSNMYGHFKEVYGFRIVFALAGIVLYSVGTKVGGISIVEEESYSGVLIEVSLLLFVMIGVINWIIGLIKNKDDYLTISNDKIKGFDDDKGEFQITKSDMKSIELIKETFTSTSGTTSDSLKKIDIKTNEENIQIDLELMSLTNYDELIENDIKEKFSEKLS